MGRVLDKLGDLAVRLLGANRSGKERGEAPSERDDSGERNPDEEGVLGISTRTAGVLPRVEVATTHGEVGEVLRGGTFYRMFSEHAQSSPELASLVAGNEALQRNISFFSALVGIEDFDESLFFKEGGREMREDFFNKLLQFEKYVSKKMELLEKKMMRSPWTKFSNNWKSNVKNACYRAFFVHYGAKRRGEVYENGRKLDYVYHTVDSAFDCLAEKMVFLDERTILATILHDSREDYVKGFLAVLNTKDPTKFKEFLGNDKKLLEDNEKEALEDKYGERFLRYFDLYEKYLDDEVTRGGLVKVEGELSLDEMLKIVTKERGKTRDETLLRIFNEIIASGDEKKMFHAFKVLMIKIADRLSNIKSLRNDPKHGTKRDILLDETIYVYLNLAIGLRMWNVVSWLQELINTADPEQRVAINKANLLAQQREGTLENFRGYFNKSLSAKVGRELVENTDYELIFRPVPLSVLTEKDRERLMVGDTEGFFEGLRNYIIFYPITFDAVMAKKAREVFEDIFAFKDRPTTPPLAKDPALNDILWKALKSNGGFGYDTTGPDPEEGKLDFGSCAYAVFDSVVDATSSTLGDYNLAYFFDDPKALIRVENMVAGLGRDTNEAESVGDQLKLMISNLEERLRILGKRSLKENGPILKRIITKLRQLKEMIIMFACSERGREVEVNLKLGDARIFPVKDLGGQISDQKYVFIRGDSNEWIPLLLVVPALLMHQKKTAFIPNPDTAVYKMLNEELSLKGFDSRLQELLEYFHSLEKELMSSEVVKRTVRNGSGVK